MRAAVDALSDGSLSLSRIARKRKLGCDGPAADREEHGFEIQGGLPLTGRLR